MKITTGHKQIAGMVLALAALNTNAAVIGENCNYDKPENYDQLMVEYKTKHLANLAAWSELNVYYGKQDFAEIEKGTMGYSFGKFCIYTSRRGDIVVDYRAQYMTNVLSESTIILGQTYVKYYPETGEIKMSPNRHNIVDITNTIKSMKHE